MTAAKREPVRTCVGCRERADRRALLRVVLDARGLIRPDETGRAPGRGAYVHRDRACIDAAVRRGALERALRAGPEASGAATLLESASVADVGKGMDHRQ